MSERKMGLTPYEHDALYEFMTGMEKRLAAFSEGGYEAKAGDQRTMAGATRADSLWLLMRAKRNLDRFIDEMVKRRGHPTATDLYDTANLMALADHLLRGNFEEADHAE